MSGRKADAGKPAIGLVPFDALREIGVVLEYGERKYAARNWELGLSWTKLVSAAMRHLGSWMMGEDRDAESGHRHLSHFACCAVMLLALVLRNQGTDDRAIKNMAPDKRWDGEAWVPANPAATQPVHSPPF